MLGKNNQYKFQKLQDQKVKKKMKKKGKQWRTITLTVTALGFGFFSFTNMTTHADQTTVQQANGGNTAPSNHTSEVHTDNSPIQNDAPTDQDKVKTTSPDASQHDQDKDKPQVDAKADNNTTKQDDDQVTPSNFTTDQQTNGQDTSHDQVNNSDNNDQNKKSQTNSEQDDHKQNNTGQDKVTVSPQSTPVAKKWDEQKVQPKEETPQEPQDQSHHDDKIAPKFDTIKINGVDKVNVAVQNPQGQVITHLPLNQDQLPQGYDGKTPLTFEQVKAATGTVKSTKGQRDNVIPAPDKDGNYNWNADQFTTAKAQNAVHSGTWGTAQWFIDNNNNLFVSNGELSNENYFSPDTSNDYHNINEQSKQFMGYFGRDSSWVDEHAEVDYIKAADGLYQNTDINRVTNDELSTNQLDSLLSGKTPSGYSDISVYRYDEDSYGQRTQSNAQGLAASIVKQMGNHTDVNLNSVNFTSSVKLPKDASNIFKSLLSQNASTYNSFDGKHIYKIYFSDGNSSYSKNEEIYAGQISSYFYNSPSEYNNINSEHYMNINSITGYANIDTSDTVNMHNVFGGQAVDPNISSWDTSNTTDMSNMMSGTQESHLDLSHNDLSKVTDFSNMANTPTLRTANLNNDTIQNSSNKANMLNGNVQEVSFNKKRAA